jgi:hypothetical protein
MKLGLFSIFCLLLLLTACQSADKEADKEVRTKSPYFDMMGLLATVEQSTKGRALQKQTIGDDKIEQGVVKDPIYKRELAIFYTADIRKPAWKGLFDITEKDGLTTYTPKNDKPDLRLMVVKRDELQQVQRVDVTIFQTNYLYSSSASGSLFLTYKGGVAMLDSISIVGEQRIVFGEPFAYTLQGKVL